MDYGGEDNWNGRLGLHTAVLLRVKVRDRGFRLPGLYVGSLCDDSVPAYAAIMEL